MDSQEIITVVANTGFPVAICIYLLVRMEAKIQQLNDTLIHLASTIEATTKNAK